MCCSYRVQGNLRHYCIQLKGFFYVFYVVSLSPFWIFGGMRIHVPPSYRGYSMLIWMFSRSREFVSSLFSQLSPLFPARTGVFVGQIQFFQSGCFHGEKLCINWCSNQISWPNGLLFTHVRFRFSQYMLRKSELKNPNVWITKEKICFQNKWKSNLWSNNFVILILNLIFCSGTTITGYFNKSSHIPE